MAFIVSIAGSDSSGGAGNQADVSCIEALGHHSLSVITAITAQNTQEVKQVTYIDATTIQAQLKTVFTSFPLGAVKSGMLPNAAGIQCLAETLKAHPQPLPYVLDPVMRASSGARLIHEESVKVMVQQLFPLATVVTPNISEVEHLTGRTLNSFEETISAGKDILELGCRAVLIKGGHALKDPGVDVFLDSHDTDVSPYIQGKFIPDRSPRGTGCTYASAISCGLASHLSLHEAIRKAKRYITLAIANAHFVDSDCWLLNHRDAANEL